MTTSATQQGMCPQRLARIDTFLKTRYIETGKLPHAHVVVARGGYASLAALGVCA